jgi:predicted nucleotidyltransferase
VNKQLATQLATEEHQAIAAFLGRLRQRFPGQVLQTILFGSKARGDSHDWSDIDILIVLEEENWTLRQDISTIAAAVSLEYDVLLGRSDGNI